METDKKYVNVTNYYVNISMCKNLQKKRILSKSVLFGSSDTKSQVSCLFQMLITPRNDFF